MTWAESTRKEKIIDILSDHPGLTPKQISDLLSEEQPDTIRKWCQRLYGDGRIVRLADGKYALPPRRKKPGAYDPEPGSWRRSPEKRKRLQEIREDLQALYAMRDKLEAEERAEADAERVREGFRRAMRQADTEAAELFDPGPGWAFKPPRPEEDSTHRAGSDFRGSWIRDYPFDTATNRRVALKWLGGIFLASVGRSRHHYSCRRGVCGDPADSKLHPCLCRMGGSRDLGYLSGMAEIYRTLAEGQEPATEIALYANASRGTPAKVVAATDSRAAHPLSPGTLSPRRLIGSCGRGQRTARFPV
jgi:hypothetical protein